MNNSGLKFFSLAIAMLLSFGIISDGLVGSAFGSHNQVKVGCKDLALTLITWDQLLALASEDGIVENEHELNENGVDPDLYEDIINSHLDDLLDDIDDALDDDKCDNLDSDIEEMLDDIDLDLPF
jgi:hypothetical protein